MTDFETQVYSRSGDDVIGVQVIASANNGQTIDTLQVTNKTQFDNLVARLDSLNEDYVQFDEDSSLAGLTIDEILENSEEEYDINAVTLNGFQSDSFAKASHNHSKSAITDLYDYDISLSRYNAEIEDNVTVTVKVTNMSGSVVSNHNIVIYKNGVVWKNGRTNSNGLYTVTYPADSSGLVTFSVNNQKVQCFVNSTWETITVPLGTLKINRSLRLAEYYVATGSKTYTANTEIMFNNNQAIIPEEFRFSNNLIQIANDYLPHLTILKLYSNGKLGGKTNGSGNKSLVGHFTWHF